MDHYMSVYIAIVAPMVLPITFAQLMEFALVSQMFLETNVQIVQQVSLGFLIVKVNYDP